MANNIPIASFLNRPCTNDTLPQIPLRKWNTLSDKIPTSTAVVVYVFEHSTHTHQHQLLVAPLSGKEGSHCFSCMMLMRSITIQEIHEFICLLSAGFGNCLLFLPAMHRSWSVSSYLHTWNSLVLFSSSNFITIWTHMTLCISSTMCS